MSQLGCPSLLTELFGNAAEVIGKVYVIEPLIPS